MTPDALVALIGLLAVAEGVGLLGITLYVLRLREQVVHLIALTRTLLKEYEAATGSRLAVDQPLLGEPADVVAEEGADVFSQIPEARPWQVR